MWNDTDSSMQNEGGFMETTANSTFDKSSNLKRGQNCVPVMIAHLNRHGEDLQVWGMPARLITLVGIVTEIETTSTKVSFLFRDETGTIKGIKWLDGGNVSYECPVTVNSYARVHGMMRNQNNENFVLILSIQPLEKLSELLTHLMEVTVVCLEGEKNMGRVAQGDYSMVNKSVNAGSSNMYEDNNIAGMGREQTIVLNIIQHGDPEYGAERNEIKSKVPPYLVSRVDEILEFLSSEGHVYTTKTDDYFKVI